MTAAQASLAELIKGGITLKADEAVAIAQALMRETSSSTLPAASTHVPLRPENVYLDADGAVVCRGCDVPTVSDVALFLRQLLPIGTAGVPGGLHYVIARALTEVDAPAFDSVEAFSVALARFEHRDGAELVRGLLETTPPGAVARSRPFTERRRPDPATFCDLRRALREADARLYEQKIAMQTLTAARPSRKWNRLAVAACLTTATAGVAAGYAMHGRLAPRPEQAQQSLALPAATADLAARPHDVVLDGPGPKTQAVSVPRPVAKRIDGSSSRTPAKPALKRGTRSRQADDDRGGVFKRLRLDWLRKAFSRRT
jgi:hypothetical protein